MTAVQFLGLPFYELEWIGFGDPRTSLGSTNVERAASSTSPFVMAMDVGAPRPRMATSVTVISQPNPSKTFVAMVVAQLNSSWGVPNRTGYMDPSDPAVTLRGSRDGSYWFWQEQTFNAELWLSGPFANGMSLSLNFHSVP